MKYYAVQVGRVPGIYNSWNECEAQVKGFSGAKYKSFLTVDEATEYISPKRKFEYISPKFDDDKIICYCDGACSNNGAPTALGGIGIYFIKQEEQISEPLPKKYKQTNQYAELYAIYKSIKIYKQTRVEHDLLIYTDSQYSINCLTKWINIWRRNNWKLSKSNKAPEHLDLVCKIDNLTKSLTTAVTFEHVKGHSSNIGNQIADKLACSGIRK